ncbi:hypothetical protein GQ53DRAFT_762499 [Thozetella sp. PMI_491]|nr:hypothetical protein GQ53DRAFT_762499 [Thozetella sp. PMI_491]
MPMADDHHDEEEFEIRKGLLWRLYISHFLSTWNMRSYEFTVILLFAEAYPESLLATSLRGVVTNGATFLFSPAIGAWVDRNASRFYTMKITIALQRACIILGCVLWIVLFVTPLHGTSRPDGQALGEPSSVPSDGAGKLVKSSIIAVLICFGIIERMCAVGNTLVMERDWVPTIASEVSHPPLHQLNAIMRRIDLISKILAPVFVSVIEVGTSPATLALITALLNAATVGVELMTAKSAWDKCHALKLAREPKDNLENDAALSGEVPEDGVVEIVEPEAERKGFALYFSSEACLASLSAALQSFSVLSLSGPMTTYLLTRNYSLPIITTARTSISVIEIGSTFIFPLAANFLRRHPVPFLPDPMAVLGVSGVTFQLALLVPCFIALLRVPLGIENPAEAYPGLTIIVFVFLGLSRLGHWTHNIAVQQIVQTKVPVAHRVGFSGVEMTFVSGAEIGRWASTAIWHKKDQFEGVALAGLMSVVLIWALFVAWVALARKRRGHAYTAI